MDSAAVERSPTDQRTDKRPRRRWILIVGPNETGSVSGLRPAGRTVATGLVVGVYHLLAVAVVWAWLASLTATPMGVEGPSVVLAYSYPANVWFVGTVIGLVLLGAVPTVLYLDSQLVTPAVVVAAWFALGVYGTWTSIPSAHLLSRPPLDLYALGGSWALATSVLVGGVEYTARHLRDRPPRRSGGE